jgi:hypothetical protein
MCIFAMLCGYDGLLRDNVLAMDGTNFNIDVDDLGGSLFKLRPSSSCCHLVQQVLFL